MFVRLPDRGTTTNATNATIPDAVIARLSDTGTACLTSPVAIDLVIDINGANPAGPAYTPLVPDRLTTARILISGEGFSLPPSD